jgi:hypothetical protein
MSLVILLHTPSENNGGRSRAALDDHSRRRCLRMLRKQEQEVWRRRPDPKRRKGTREVQFPPQSIEGLKLLKEILQVVL